MRTLDILELLVRQKQPMAAHEIAGALTIPVSSLAYLLATLVDRGYVERLGRRYGPGPSLAKLNPAQGELTLAERVAPLVRSLRIELNETAGFFVRTGFEIEAVASEIGVHALRYTLEVGQRAPLHSFAAGKAILATMGDEELDHYLRTVPRSAFTTSTIVDATALRAEVETIRRSGIARTREEDTSGIIGVGRAAFAGDTALGAFSVAIPMARFDDTVDARVVRALTRSTQLLAAAEAPPPAAVND
jgi:IclR family acetate operon transcriptional repressor